MHHLFPWLLSEQVISLLFLPLPHSLSLSLSLFLVFFFLPWFLGLKMLVVSSISPYLFYDSFKGEGKKSRLIQLDTKYCSRREPMVRALATWPAAKWGCPSTLLQIWPGCILSKGPNSAHFTFKEPGWVFGELWSPGEEKACIHEAECLVRQGWLWTCLPACGSPSAALGSTVHEIYTESAKAPRAEW